MTFRLQSDLCTSFSVSVGTSKDSEGCGRVGELVIGGALPCLEKTSFRASALSSAVRWRQLLAEERGGIGSLGDHWIARLSFDHQR